MKADGQWEVAQQIVSVSEIPAGSTLGDMIIQLTDYLQITAADSQHKTFTSDSQ